MRVTATHNENARMFEICIEKKSFFLKRPKKNNKRERKMKNALLTSLTISLLLLSSCKEKSTNPPDTPLPEGYQQDVPWPSLADSPWPRYHGNAQNNGRTNLAGPQLVSVLSILETPQLLGGIVVGADSNLYFCTAGSVYSLTKDGAQNWKVSFGDSEIESPPLIGSDGTIFVGLFQGEKLVALDKKGSIKWSTTIPNGIASRFSIGKTGIIYATNTRGTLYAIDNTGTILWQLVDNDFKSIGNSSFSVDGKTLYLSSHSSAVMAIDIETKSVLWKFGSYANSTSVDALGNIYVVGRGTGGINDTTYYYSLTSSGSIRWKYKLTDWKYLGDQDPAIDKYGNSYFAEDTLYSIDYKGKLRWKISFPNEYYRAPILCDGGNNLYAISESNGLKIYCFNNSGITKWVFPIDAEGIVSPSGAIGYNNRLYFSTDNGMSKIFTIQ